MCPALEAYLKVTGTIFDHDNVYRMLCIECFLKIDKLQHRVQVYITLSDVYVSTRLMKYLLMIALQTSKHFVQILEWR